jgi:magnesium-transporting ATPase (P-type)
MASFDFVDVAAKGYEFCWKQRGYLARLAFPVVFVKIACLLTVVLLHAQDNILRKELLLMPAYFVEAVFLCGLVRYILYKEPIAMIGCMAKPSKDNDFSPLRTTSQGSWNRNQCLQAGIVFFLLFKIISAVWQWINTAVQSIENNPEIIQSVPPTGFNAMLALLILGVLVWFLLWLVRFAWLFVSVAQGYSVKAYVQIVRDFKIPLFIIATMLLCFVPFSVLFENLKTGVISVFEGQNALQILSLSTLEALDETLIMAICTIAMAHAIHEMFHPPKAKEK